MKALLRLSIGVAISSALVALDIDAFTEYLTAHESPPLAPPAASRITKN